MIRALKAAMIAYGVIGIFFGLAFIFVPKQLGVSQGFEVVPKYQPYFLMLLGSYYVAPSIFLIVAGRDPVRHISWVRFAILWTILSVLTQLYCLIRGFVTFGQTELGLIIDGAFAVAFIVFYPRGASRGGETK